MTPDPTKRRRASPRKKAAVPQQPLEPGPAEPGYRHQAEGVITDVVGLGPVEVTGGKAPIEPIGTKKDTFAFLRRWWAYALATRWLRYALAALVVLVVGYCTVKAFTVRRERGQISRAAARAYRAERDSLLGTVAVLTQQRDSLVRVVRANVAVIEAEALRADGQLARAREAERARSRTLSRLVDARERSADELPPAPTVNVSLPAFNACLSLARTCPSLATTEDLRYQTMIEAQQVEVKRLRAGLTACQERIPSGWDTAKDRAAWGVGGLLVGKFILPIIFE